MRLNWINANTNTAAITLGQTDRYKVMVSFSESSVLMKVYEVERDNDLLLDVSKRFGGPFRDPGFQEVLRLLNTVNSREIPA